MTLKRSKSLPKEVHAVLTPDTDGSNFSFGDLEHEGDLFTKHKDALQAAAEIHQNFLDDAEYDKGMGRANMSKQRLRDAKKIRVVTFRFVKSVPYVPPKKKLIKKAKK